MFCKHCGFQLSDGSQFCSRCGKKVDERDDRRDAHKELSIVSDSDPIDRKILLNYLYQLQVVEFSADKLKQIINRLNYNISRLGKAVQPSKPYKMGVDLGAIGGFLFLGVIAAIGGKLLYSLIPWGLFSFASGVGVIIIIVTIVGGLISAASKESDYKEREEEYKRQIAEEAIRVQQELLERDALIEQRDGFQKNLDEAERVMEKAYSANVIPKQFRNLYAVYYLYEYLSTSQSTLESAMLHFDLNEIKAKLDSIIDQQEQIVLQNAISISQNDKIIEQNSNIIRSAMKIETNAERIAQYEAIQATNSGVIAFTNTVMASIMVSKM